MQYNNFKATFRMTGVFFGVLYILLI